MKNQRARTIVGFAAATWVAFLVGCSDSGPERGEVSGTVLLDGQPVADAEVVFEPQQGSPSYGMTDAEGGYELRFTADKSGAVLGRHTVRISTARVTGGPGEQTEVPERIPVAYNAQSQETREVVSGSNQFDFEIKTNP